MTIERINELKTKIDSMNHYQLAYYYRFSPAGDEIFITKELSDYFMVRFQSFGGMTPTISKEIGW